MSSADPGRLDDARLEGERVRLRPVTPADANAAFALIHEREAILRWLIWPGPQEPVELERYYADWRGATGDDFNFAIEDLESGALAGTCGVRGVALPASADLGYWLGEPFWGRGFATETIELLTWLAFEHLDARVSTACVFVGNDASRRALEKNGYELDHTSTCEVRARPQPQWHLGLSRRVWRAARERGAIPEPAASHVVRASSPAPEDPR